MNMDEASSKKTSRSLFTRPISLVTAVGAIVVILYEVNQLYYGNLYLETLNYIDGTTLIMLGILMLRGVISLREDTDLQAAAYTLVNSLSFIFAYEALFKWSFYLTPFRLPMPPPEFREFLIQVGTALTVLTAFAAGRFTVKRWTVVFFGLFVVLWAFWLLVGFPQLSGQVMFPPVINISFSHMMTYILNRATKVVLFLVYFTFFPSGKKNPIA